MATGTVITGQVEASVTPTEDTHVMRKMDLGTFGLTWTFSIVTTATDPGAGLIQFDNAVLAAVTTIYVSDQVASGLDVSAVLLSVTQDQLLLIQQFNEPNTATVFRIVAPPTDNSGWWSIPVAVETTNGTLPEDEEYLGVVTLGLGTSSSSSGA